MMPNKSTYNKLLKRHDKAVKWFLDPKTTDEDRDKFEPLFLEIVSGLAEMVEEFIKSGVPMTGDEIRDGFKLD